MLEATNHLGIVFFPAYDWAISPTHPEREERLLYTQDQLREEGIFDIEGLREYKPDLACLADVERVHFCFPDVPHILTESHLISAGGAIKAARLIMEERADKAFAMVRPPGHHARKTVHGNRGFCNINIEAVMIEYIREQYGPQRVAIVDTDCHHGDGTQDVYWHDPDTLFISLHQDGRTLYPGSGFPWEFGGPSAAGKTVNIPLPPQTGDEGFIYVMENVVLPILDDFKPDLVINSAGQDNHFSDPITNMNFSAQGYARLNEMLDPDIAVLEGGYSIHGALPYVNLGIVLAMAGLDYSHVREPNFNRIALSQQDRITDYIKRLADEVNQVYFNTPVDRIQGERDGDFFARENGAFYDTDGIQEEQTDAVLLCDHCPGVRRIETESTVNPLSLGVEIPQRACERCVQTGNRLYEEALARGRYRYLQLINRRDKEYRRHPA